MCELMTIAAALAFTALYFTGKSKGWQTKALFTTMLTFWGAALMWGVDCVAEKLDGEPLLDLSRESAVQREGEHARDRAVDLYLYVAEHHTLVQDLLELVKKLDLIEQDVIHPRSGHSLFEIAQHDIRISQLPACPVVQRSGDDVLFIDS